MFYVQGKFQHLIKLFVVKFDPICSDPWTKPKPHLLLKSLNWVNLNEFKFKRNDIIAWRNLEDMLKV